MRSFLKGRRIAFRRIFLSGLLLLLLGVGIPCAVRLNTGVPDTEKYPVQGIDVSRYQGNIDWSVIASQNVTFAFIKATEGSSHQDPCFHKNWFDVQNTNIYAGAYHFFSFESAGATQAQNFIDTVGSLTENSLPPVIDLEFYGDYGKSPLSRKETRQILNDLLSALEKYYQVKPIIYTTSKAYYQYIFGGGYGEYPMWIRNTYTEPVVGWSFWQYSDEGKLAGYDGIQKDHTEMYIDLNVYRSSYEDFLKEFSLPETKETILEQNAENDTKKKETFT